MDVTAQTTYVISIDYLDLYLYTRVIMVEGHVPIRNGLGLIFVLFGEGATAPVV